MEEKRLLSELLQLLLKEFKSPTDRNEKYNGLCYTIGSLYNRSIITCNECNILRTFLLNNRPEYRPFIDEFTSVNKPDSGYYWKRGVQRPRIQ